MLGAFVNMNLADRFGRKKVLLTNWLLLSVIVGVTAAVNNYYAFTVLRFLTGFCQQVSIETLTYEQMKKMMYFFICLVIFSNMANTGQVPISCWIYFTFSHICL